MEIYFKKKSTTDQTCSISQKDLKRVLLADNIYKTWSEFQMANDDSSLANALLDTLCLVLLEETDILGKGSFFNNSAGPSISCNGLIGLIAERIQTAASTFLSLFGE